jgi:hypothetical protein
MWQEWGGRVTCIGYWWIDNIYIDLVGIGLDVVDWIGLAQDRYR